MPIPATAFVSGCCAGGDLIILLFNCDYACSEAMLMLFSLAYLFLIGYPGSFPALNYLARLRPSIWQASD